jgi:hypothetical protein
LSFNTILNIATISAKIQATTEIIKTRVTDLNERLREMNNPIQERVKNYKKLDNDLKILQSGRRLAESFMFRVILAKVVSATCNASLNALLGSTARFIIFDFVPGDSSTGCEIGYIPNISLTVWISFPITSIFISMCVLQSQAANTCDFYYSLSGVGPSCVMKGGLPSALIDKYEDLFGGVHGLKLIVDDKKGLSKMTQDEFSKLQREQQIYSQNINQIGNDIQTVYAAQHY